MNKTDKRSIKTDALETLGFIIDETAGRDAIHLAVEPIVAGERLKPGEDIGIRNGQAFLYHKFEKGPVKLLGIVDPFLKEEVEIGERFWLVVYPRTITSLRHVWSHPGFEETTSSTLKKESPVLEDPQKTSEEWLKTFLRDNDGPYSYEGMIQLIKDGGVDDEEYFYVGDLDGHCIIPDEFWNHIEVVTGKKMSIRPKQFSCSC